MLIVRGGHCSAWMSATEWIGASQVMRSRWESRTGSVSAVSLGSSIQASREGLNDAPVELRVGRVVDDRAFVLALQVDRIDRVQRDERGDQLDRPRTASGRA